MIVPRFVESKCRRVKGGRGDEVTLNNSYVNVMSLVWG